MSAPPRRVLAVAPGRGSYGPSEVGWLARTEAESERASRAVSRVVRAVDAARARRGLGSIREIDSTKPFSADVHGTGENASALIFACSCVDAELLPESVEVAGILGNSLGFYSALAISGALGLEEAANLVIEIASLQAELAHGTQLLYPVVDDEWRRSTELERALSRVVASLPGMVFPSIHLSGIEVVAADEGAVPALLSTLPRARLGGRDYPLVLEGHKGFHSPLAALVAARARLLSGLGFRAPTFHLVDGRGAIHTPWSADPRALESYTLDHQLREPFDFHAALRVGLCELAPDAVLIFGPGEMGGAVGRAVALERIFGVRDRESFLARQREAPLVYALGRMDQRKALLGLPRLA